MTEKKSTTHKDDHRVEIEQVEQAEQEFYAVMTSYRLWVPVEQRVDWLAATALRTWQRTGSLPGKPEKTLAVIRREIETARGQIEGEQEILAARSDEDIAAELAARKARQEATVNFSDKAREDFYIMRLEAEQERRAADDTGDDGPGDDGPGDGGPDDDGNAANAASRWDALREKALGIEDRAAMERCSGDPAPSRVDESDPFGSPPHAPRNYSGPSGEQYAAQRRAQKSAQWNMVAIKTQPCPLKEGDWIEVSGVGLAMMVDRDLPIFIPDTVTGQVTSISGWRSQAEIEAAFWHETREEWVFFRVWITWPIRVIFAWPE